MSEQWNGTYHVAPGMTSRVGKCFAASPATCPYNSIAGHDEDRDTQVAAAEALGESQHTLVASHASNGSKEPVSDVRRLREAKTAPAPAHVAASVQRVSTAKSAIPNRSARRNTRKSPSALGEKFGKVSTPTASSGSHDASRLTGVKYWMSDIHR